MLALVDANYRFLYVDVGNYGRVSDGGVFNNSSLSKALASNSLCIPTAETVWGLEKKVPYVVVADDAFALKPNIMKPYGKRGLTMEQRVFNYRLSRARRVVENAFGILSQRFRIFTRSIPLSPEKVQVLTMAACCLHNFLTRDSTSSATYIADLVTDDRQNKVSTMQSLLQQGSNRNSINATEVRELFCSYFSSAAGAVSWQ